MPGTLHGKSPVLAVLTLAVATPDLWACLPASSSPVQPEQSHRYPQQLAGLALCTRPLRLLGSGMCFLG